jgi:DNA-binding transcriptional MocR family regulator
LAESTATRLLNRDVLDGYPPNERLVVLTLALMASAKDGAYPSDRTLARKTGTSRNTVRAALDRAEADGVIERIVERADQRSRSIIVYRFPKPSRTGSPAEQDTGSPAEPDDAATGSQTGSEMGESGSESLARIGTLEHPGNSAVAPARPSHSEKPDTREPWQIRKDAEAEAEAERNRPRTPEELAEIERKRQAQDEADRRETERRDRELEEAIAADPELVAKAAAMLRKLGLTAPASGTT